MIIKWSYYQPYHYHIIILSWVLVDAGPAPNQTCDSRSLLSAADRGWKRQTAVRPGVSLDQPGWGDFDQNRAFVSEWALNGAMVAGAPRGGGGGGVEQIGDLILCLQCDYSQWRLQKLTILIIISNYQLLGDPKWGGYERTPSDHRVFCGASQLL